jgi:hypothetical protein
MSGGWWPEHPKCLGVYQPPPQLIKRFLSHAKIAVGGGSSGFESDRFILGWPCHPQTAVRSGSKTTPFSFFFFFFF